MDSSLMLGYSAHQIIRDADVEHRMVLIGEDIDVVEFHLAEVCGSCKREGKIAALHFVALAMTND